MNAPTAAAHLLPQIQLRDVPQALIDALQAQRAAKGRRKPSTTPRTASPSTPPKAP